MSPSLFPQPSSRHNHHHFTWTPWRPSQVVFLLPPSPFLYSMCSGQNHNLETEVILWHFLAWNCPMKFTIEVSSITVAYKVLHNLVSAFITDFTSLALPVITEAHNPHSHTGFPLSPGSQSLSFAMALALAVSLTWDAPSPAILHSGWFTSFCASPRPSCQRGTLLTTCSVTSFSILRLFPIVLLMHFMHSSYPNLKLSNLFTCSFSFSGILWKYNLHEDKDLVSLIHLASTTSGTGPGAK